MPPKPKITKDMVVNAAFEITRTEGAEHINARAISKQLGCSTQPVMYLFPKMEDIKREVYAKADAYHSAYITNVPDSSTNPMLCIGLLYIRFAVEEQHLFRFLFQSNQFSKQSFFDLIDAEELEPVLAVLQQATQTDREQAKDIFLSIFLPVHGYASMLANNSMEYDEASIASHLEKAFQGAICVAKMSNTSNTGGEIQ